MNSEFQTIDVRRTLYRIMMVDEAADQDIIRSVYRELARRHHPDVDASAQAVTRMAEINEAYSVLRDPSRRSRYNAALAEARRRARAADLPSPSPRPQYGDAGVPVGPPAGPLIDFGRYRGWTLGQIRRHDPDFLEWLVKMPVGRRYQAEITDLLRRPA